MSSLSHSPADVVRWLLVDLGLGTDPADGGSWPIHVANEPNLPDNLVVVYDTTGMTDGRVQRTGETAEHRGVMVQVRGVDHPTTWAKAEAVREVLDESVSNYLVTAGSTEYVVHAVTRQSGPIALGREPNTNRVLFSLNVVAAIKQLT